MNISINGETEEGQTLIQKYGLRSYPGLLIVDAEERPIVVEFGYHTADWLLNFGKSNFKKGK